MKKEMAGYRRLNETYLGSLVCRMKHRQIRNDGLVYFENHLTESPYDYIHFAPVTSLSLSACFVFNFLNFWLSWLVYFFFTVVSSLKHS